MNSLQLFNNAEFGDLRTVTIDGEPWFVGKDVALALGYSVPKKAIYDHVDDEDKRGFQISTPGGEQEVKIINESGLYSLILSSKLPSAKRFKRWVTSEVLPALRKNGSYTITPQRELTKDDYIKAASMVSSCKNERLPYVLGFLEQAGFRIPEVEEVQFQPEIEADELMELLNKYSLSELTEKLNICRTSLYYYRIGRHKPQEERLKYIIEALS